MSSRTISLRSLSWLTTSDSIQKASNLVRITANSLRFTCDRDNNATNHNYPRTTDPVHNTNIAIAATAFYHFYWTKKDD